jgi:hypothetical protein
LGVICGHCRILAGFFLFSYPFQSHRVGSEFWDENREEVTPYDVPPETSFKKNGIYIMLNFLMSFGSFIPVQPGFVVVNCVIAIIKKEKIQKSDKVSGMIPLGFFVGVNMLEVIKY